MKLKTLVGLLGAMAAGSVFATVSNVITVFGNPEETIQWKTVLSNTMNLGLDWPEGAASAKLTLTQAGRVTAAELTDTSATSVPLAVVWPRDGRSECVLELSLVYRDAQGDAVGGEQTARLGLVRGVGAQTARCILDTSARDWWRVRQSAVLPVPEDTEELTVNDVAVDPLDSPGWWLWKVAQDGSNAVVRVSTDAVTNAVVLTGRLSRGLAVTIR